MFQLEQVTERNEHLDEQNRYMIKALKKMAKRLDPKRRDKSKSGMGSGGAAPRSAAASDTQAEPGDDDGRLSSLSE